MQQQRQQNPREVRMMDFYILQKLCTVKEILKKASSQNLKSPTQKTKIWHNNLFSTRFVRETSNRLKTHIQL